MSELQTNGTADVPVPTAQEQLLDRLNDPDTTATLNSLLDNIELLTSPEFVPQLTQLLKTGAQFAKVTKSEEFQVLLQSGVLAPDTLKVVGQAGDALVKSQQTVQSHEEKSVGVLGLLRAIPDPGVQRSLGFLIAFSKSFGKKLNA